MNELPTTAIGVLEQFQPTKEGILSFANKVISDIKEGKVSPLRARILCSTMKEIGEIIDKATKADQIKEAQTYGEKPFMFSGAEMHLTSTKTDYIYDTTNDPIYFDLLKKFEDAKTALDARKEFLKNIPYEGQTIVDESTGEAVLIRRAGKKQTDGVKVTLK